MGIGATWVGVFKYLVRDPEGFYGRLSGQDVYGFPLKFAAVSSAVVGLELDS